AADGVEERPGLGVEIEDRLIAGKPGGTLIEDDVALGHHVLGLEVVRHLVVAEFHVLVREDHVTLEDDVLLFLEGLMIRLPLRFPSPFRGSEEFELALLGESLLVVLRRRAHVFALGEQNRGGETAEKKNEKWSRHLLRAI